MSLKSVDRAGFWTHNKTSGEGQCPEPRATTKKTGNNRTGKGRLMGGGGKRTEGPGGPTGVSTKRVGVADQTKNEKRREAKIENVPWKKKRLDMNRIVDPPPIGVGVASERLSVRGVKRGGGKIKGEDYDKKIPLIPEIK